MVAFSKFKGLQTQVADWSKFTILDYRPDPHVDGVYLFHLWFVDTKEYGLAIYDTNQQGFIEEPSDYDDYNTTIEKIEKQYGFKHNQVN